MRAAYRYLLWVAYDGSRFHGVASMNVAQSVIGFLQSLLKMSFADTRNELRIAASSRTDSGVHALRNAFIVHLPVENADNKKKELLKDWNEDAMKYTNGSLNFLDFHSVSAGFCARGNVSCRRYKYRIGVAENEDIWSSSVVQPALWQFAEGPYMWILPNGFDPQKAAHACASFTIRYMVRMIAECAYGNLPVEMIEWMLANPNPENFHRHRLTAAPPQGLFLEDVVYDTRMFTNPIPFHHHPWDDEHGMKSQ